MKKQMTPLTILTSKSHGQKGFTLIELIMVIVILGILAAVAVPKYQSLKGDASKAAANGMYAGAQAACAINFANNMLHPAGDPGHTALITTGQTLLDAMDNPPADWGVPAGGETTPPTIVATISGSPYTITITSVESATAKAKLSKSW
ncbi:type II secretion system protein [Desulfobacterota bacterium M19]